MSYSPVPTPGQANSAASAPVVLAADDVISTDIDSANQLDELTTGIKALASAKGIAADIRVTVLNGTLSVAVGSGTLNTVTNLSQLGGINANGVIQDLENNTYNGAFSANITRP